MLRRNPAYARVWLADAVSLVGDWFSLIALAVLVGRVSGGSGLAISGLLLAQLLPSVLIGPFAGVLVDRLDRKTLLIISDLVRFAITLLFLLARGPGDLWLIYLLTFAQFTVSSIFEPARSAMMPRLVRPNDLVTANVLSSVTWSAMLALGGLLGGVVASYFGVEAGLLLNALSFLLSAGLVIPVRPIDGGTFRAVAEHGHAAGSGGLLAGLRYLRARPAVAMLLLLKSGIALGGSDTLRILYATLAFADADNGAWSLGVLSAAAGVGAVLGPLLAERWNDGSVPRMRRLAGIALAGCTIGIFLISRAETLLVAVLVFIFRAATGSTVWTYSAVLIQQTTDDAVRGRVFALDMAANQLAAVTAILAIGALVERGSAASLRAVTAQLGFVTLLPLLGWLVALALVKRAERAALPEAG